MRHVILRDDDTNALTPIACLERLYRPFLERNLPVNLATIPKVNTSTRTQDGSPEGYLLAARNGDTCSTRELARGEELTEYLLANPRFHIVQHGYQHALFEFDSPDAGQTGQWLDHGTHLLTNAGFGRPATFVAPYDRLSRSSYREVARRFDVISTGWFELKRLPLSWWPRYLFKKARKQAHWRVGRTVMLSHPGCLLSYRKPRAGMLDQVKRSVASAELTVLVTHWWEYFRDGRPDEEFIRILHQVAEWLSDDDSIKVGTFADLVRPRIVE
jgi:hypothetical protein